MKVGTILGGDDLEAIWNAVNSRYFRVVTLRQTSHTRLAAFGTPQFFVPLIGHGQREYELSACLSVRSRTKREPLLKLKGTGNHYEQDTKPRSPTATIGIRGSRAGASR
jgi:hypothetical protein